jgi:hypothetical protein
VEVDYKRNCRHDQVIPRRFQSRKAVPMSTDNLFSTTSSDGEDMLTPTVTSPPPPPDGKHLAVPTNNALSLPSQSLYTR